MTAPLPPERLRRLVRRFPLVSRSHLVYPSFAERVEEVHRCARKSTQDRPLRDRINLACASWNLSALIASDCGLTDLATDLCLRQQRLFQAALPVTGDSAIGYLQPIINLVRLTARAGNPQAAYQQLMSLHQAVHHGGTVTVHGHPIDLTGFTTDATRDHLRPWLHSVLLEDGTRFLVATGQWPRAAEHAAVYDQAPERLHDSRQARIMASLHTADLDQANSLIDKAAISEPWEQAVAQILRHYADQLAGRATPEGFATVARAVREALDPAPPNLRMFRVRLALAAIDVASEDCEAQVQALQGAIVSDTAQAGDAYAAREILRHPVLSTGEGSRRELESIVRDGGFRQGVLPEPTRTTMLEAVSTAGASLVQCLAEAAEGITREAVMGSSDSTASPSNATADTDSVSAVSTDTIATPESAAERLRNALVDKMRESGSVHTPGVETALRAVPRHLFVPSASLEDAYANSPVHIKYDGDGTSISCASQPDIVALMLEQLDPQHGQRVLELGAGTGYNAGLLGHIVGDTGHVTTIDVDQDLVDGARTHLAAAGIDNVQVLLGDGALGHPQGAPYHRIIATVGAYGVPREWMDQLAPGGRLLVPQRLRGSVCRSIAYERRDGAWRSTSSRMNTFMPLRQGIADDPRRMIALTPDSSVRVQIHGEQTGDAQALQGVLDQPSYEAWPGVKFRGQESTEWMWLWLACVMDNGLSRMEADASAVEHGLVRPKSQPMAVVGKSAIAYLAYRLADLDAEGRQQYELGVIGHGHGSGELADHAAAEIRTWDREYRDRAVEFELQPLDCEPPAPRPGRFALSNALSRVVIEWC